MKKIFSAIAVLTAFAMVAVSCNDDDTKDEDIPVTEVKVTPTAVSVVAGTTTTLKAGTDEFLAKDIGQIRYDLDQKVWAIIDQNKINIYNKETTRLIKRAV